MKNKILIIDDEELIIKSLNKLLENNGYETFIVKNGQDAIEVLEEESYDLIICDIRMPGLNGVETIKKIKEISANNGTLPPPVIFATGYTDEKSEKEAKALEPAAYIYKPFEIQDLLDIIQSSLGKESR